MFLNNNIKLALDDGSKGDLNAKKKEKEMSTSLVRL